MNSVKPRRLFFCVTPLNLLVAQAIRSIAPGTDTLVHVPPVSSPKYRFYFDRFEWDRKISVAVEHRRLPDLPSQVLKTIRVLRQLNGCHFDQLLFANIGSVHFATLAKKYRDAAIMTFDDGALHVDPQMFANWLAQEPLTHRIYRRLTGACTNESILARAERHYTIFPPELCRQNVPEVVGIPLFADLPAPSPTSQRIKVLLGTPLPGVSLGMDADTYERLVSIIDPDIYLPHPQERRPPMVRLAGENRGQIMRAAETLIAEDFTRELVKLGYSPVIEGFRSTALLNLAGQFPTKTYYSTLRPAEPIYQKLGVKVEAVEHHLIGR